MESQSASLVLKAVIRTNQARRNASCAPPAQLEQALATRLVVCVHSARLQPKAEIVWTNVRNAISVDMQTLEGTPPANSVLRELIKTQLASLTALPVSPEAIQTKQHGPNLVSCVR